MINGRKRCVCCNIPLLIVTLSIRGQPGGDGNGAHTRSLDTHGSEAGLGSLEKGAGARAAPCLPQPSIAHRLTRFLTEARTELCSLCLSERGAFVGQGNHHLSLLQRVMIRNTRQDRGCSTRKKTNQTKLNKSKKPHPWRGNSGKEGC